VFRINEQFDAAGGPWLLSDEARTFERHDHLVNCRWGDSKILLDVGLCRRPAMQARIEVDVREILPLLGREAFARGLTPAI
jgi:hypothetical protein